MSRIRELSADEETRRLAFVRERALRDEVSLLNDARREGEAHLFAKLVKMKFGELPEWAQHRLEQSNSDQINQWSAKILTANSIDELFHH